MLGKIKTLGEIVEALAASDSMTVHSLEKVQSIKYDIDEALNFNFKDLDEDEVLHLEDTIYKTEQVLLTFFQNLKGDI